MVACDLVLTINRVNLIARRSRLALHEFVGRVKFDDFGRCKSIDGKQVLLPELVFNAYDVSEPFMTNVWVWLMAIACEVVFAHANSLMHKNR